MHSARGNPLGLSPACWLPASSSKGSCPQSRCSPGADSSSFSAACQERCSPEPSSRPALSPLGGTDRQPQERRELRAARMRRMQPPPRGSSLKQSSDKTWRWSNPSQRCRVVPQLLRALGPPECAGAAPKH